MPDDVDSHSIVCLTLYLLAAHAARWHQGSYLGTSRLQCIQHEGHISVMHMSLQIDNWNRFDVFQVGNLSKGKPLETVTLALFARHDLLEKLKIPYDRLQKFVRVSCLR